MRTNEILLKYGCNPHQSSARVFSKDGGLPIAVVNGKPGYINLLDALNSWQLVNELKSALGLPAAASFKHVSPAGVAVATPLSDDLKKTYFVGSIELSPTATAYARARGADRLSSFGDWAALSDAVDVSTAKLLKREVSDGVIAPRYEPEALEILKQKKRGKYIIIETDPDYDPPEIESRDVYGVVFEQDRNNLKVTSEIFQNIATEKKDIPSSAQRDLLVATIALKYTQSNSVCLALDGQVIGSGAGQQSRLHCTRLACSKADRWHLRQHPKVLALKFKEGLRRPEKANAIDQYLEEDLTHAEKDYWETMFDDVPDPLTREERKEWIAGLKDVSLSSDAYLPFRDNLDRASRSGVRYVVQAGGSIRDSDVIEAADQYGMVMALSGVRLFHH